MSKLLNAFSNSQKKMKASTAKVSGHIILKPTKFNEDHVVGEVLSGPNVGAEISVKYAGKLKQADYTKRDKTKVDIEAGGVLRVENLRASGDMYECQWMKTFLASPGKNDFVMGDAVCSFVDTGRRDNPTGDEESAPIWMVNKLVMSGEKFVNNIEELKAAMIEAFETEDAIVLFGTDGEEVVQAPYSLQGKLDENKKWQRNDPAERVEDIIASFGDNIDLLKETLADGGFSVVPSRGYRVGRSTALNVELAVAEAEEHGKRARISTIDPQNWACPTMGMRLDSSLKAKDGDTPVFSNAEKDKLADAFKKFADDDEKAQFVKSGWRGLSNETLSKFFEENGVNLTNHPSRGWSTQAFVERREEGYKNGYLTKSFQLRATSPYPPVKALEGTRADYYAEMGVAAKSVLDELRAEAGAKTSDKKKDVEKKADQVKEEALPEDDVSDTMDDILSEMDLDS